MKNLILLICLLIQQISFTQCIIHSQNYDVHVVIEPISLQITTNGGGCTYKVLLRYSVDFTGPNVPSSLYTLQGTIHCGNNNVFFDGIPQTEGNGFTYSSTSSFSGDCSSLTLSNLCNSINLTIQGPNLPYQVVNCSFSQLPLEFIYFSGQYIDGVNSIIWGINPDNDCDTYIIERSIDAIDWEQINITNASSNIDYFTIDDAFKPVINYYRLVTVKNGKQKVHETISIDNRVKEEEVEEVLNLLGQPCGKEDKGYVIILYKSGKTRRVYNN